MFFLFFFFAFIYPVDDWFGSESTYVTLQTSPRLFPHIFPPQAQNGTWQTSDHRGLFFLRPSHKNGASSESLLGGKNRAAAQSTNSMGKKNRKALLFIFCSIYILFILYCRYRFFFPGDISSFAVMTPMVLGRAGKNHVGHQSDAGKFCPS